jgi:hypothetical protein
LERVKEDANSKIKLDKLENRDIHGQLRINVEKNKLKSQQIDRRQWINKKTTKKLETQRDKMK